MRKSKWYLYAPLVGALGLSATAHGAILIDDKFSTFTPGDLVGQNGYAQTLASSTMPLQVSGGNLVFPGLPLNSGDNQDAYKQIFASPITAPGAGTTSLYATLDLTVTSAVAGVNTGYFFAFDNNSDATGFENHRLFAKDNSVNVPGTFVLQGKHTGQGAAAFVNSGPLNYNQQYTVVVEADLTAGAGNDALKVFVNPVDLSGIPDITATGGTDATGLGAFVLSQFTSASLAQSGINVSSIRISDTAADAVPEPASLSLIALASGCLLRRRR